MLSSLDTDNVNLPSSTHKSINKQDYTSNVQQILDSPKNDDIPLNIEEQFNNKQKTELNRLETEERPILPDTSLIQTQANHDLEFYDLKYASFPVQFSSHVLPNDPKLMHKSVNPIPVGCLFSPFVSLKPEVPRRPLYERPERCKKCDAFMNLYNYANIDKGNCVRTCVFCGRKEIEINCVKENGNIEEERCNDTESIQNRNKQFEMNHKIIEYVIDEPETPTIFVQRTLIFLVDANFASSSFKDLYLSIDNVLMSVDVPDNLRIGLIVFGQNVQIYSVGFKNSEKNELTNNLANIEIENKTETSVTIGENTQNKIGNSEFKENECLDQIFKPILTLNGNTSLSIHEIVDTFSKVNGDCTTIELSKKLFGEKSLAHSNVLSILDCLYKSAMSKVTTKSGSKKPSEAGPRSLGLALSIALTMLTEIDIECQQGNIVIFSAGAPNIGPGKIALDFKSSNTETINKNAAEFYTNISRIAQENFVTIDMFFEGYSRVGTAILRNLTKNTGGNIFLYRQFGCEEFAKDVEQALFTDFRYAGEIEVYCSPSSLLIDTILGSISYYPSNDMDKTEKSTLLRESKRSRMNRRFVSDQKRFNSILTGHQKSFLNKNKTQQLEQSFRKVFILNSLKNRDSLAFYFYVDQKLPGDFAYFQFIVYYNNSYNQRIARICTFRIVLSEDLPTYIRSLDSHMVATLIGKFVVLKAENQSQVDSFWDDHLTDIHYIIDKYVKRIYNCFGKRIQTSSGKWALTLDSHLSDLPLILYLLRNGSMLGPLMQNYDDISNLRALYLHSNLQDAMRIVMPQLIAYDSKGNVEQFPLYNMSMQSNRILYLDNHTHMFIQSGKDVDGEEYDQYRNLCLQRCLLASYNRFPQPRIFFLRENSSDERQLRNRLIPSHNDSISQQTKDFPQLNDLQPSVRSKLLDKFFPTDELSFRQYLIFLFKQDQTQ